MTLTELRYIVAVARERHFGRAAQLCFVSQPTLSQAIKKLEEELDVKLFERSANEVSPTDLGREIIEQAAAVLDQVAAIKETAKRGKDPLAGPLRLGLIYTIGPYLLPELVRRCIERTPQMPLVLQENFTTHLLDGLREGLIDCAILAEPFADAGLAVAALYDEPFVAALPRRHPLAAQAHVSTDQLRSDTLLLLGSGHCFRDHVLQVCPEYTRFATHSEGLRKTFEGSSLETIKHMVASGMGVTLLPRLSVPQELWQAQQQSLQKKKPAKGRVAQKEEQTSAEVGRVAYRAVVDAHGEPPPTRRVVLAWRRSYTRYEAIAALRNAIYACTLEGVQRIT